MPVATELLSLKGESPVWGGLVDFSEVAPSAGMFTSLSGVVIGKDGTELERFPGTVLSGTPFIGEMIRPIAGTGGFTNHSGVDTSIHFGRQTTTSYLQGHGLEFTTGATTSVVWLNIVYKSSTGFVRVQSKHTALITGSHTIRINGLSSTLWISLQPESEVYVSRDSSTLHGLIWAADSPCVIAESVYHDSHNGKNAPKGAKKSIATWVGEHALDWEDSDFFPITNRIDSKPLWRYWGNPINTDPMDLLDHNGNSFFLGGTYEKEPVRFSHPPRRKANLHVANDDLIIAVPGYGFVLTCTLSGKAEEQQNITQWTRLLGTPKGNIGRHIWTAAGVAGHNPFQKAEKFWLSIGYRNRFTGEVGLASKPIEINPADFNHPGPGSNYYLTLAVDTPRHSMAEAAGMSIILYSSGLQGQETVGFEPIFETVLYPDQVTVRILLDRQLVFKPGATGGPNGWVQFPQYPRIEQLPMGASWAVTIRGITFFGGAIGYSESLGIERLEIKSWWKVRDRFYVVEEPHLQVEGQLAAGRRLPSSYQGAVSRTQTEVEQGNSRGQSKDNQIILNLDENHIDNVNEWRLHEWSIENGLFGVPQRTQDNYLDVKMARGQVWHSEPGHPGITPSINRILIDLVEGEDIRAAGRLGDSIILCTELETYSVSWGRSPLGSHPRILSNNFGCIAPNAMVDFPGGLAWLSKDGPVVSDGGSPAWVGATIAKFWSTLERDSFGLMWQACGVYDQENKRIIWGVRRGTHNSAASLEASKSPAFPGNFANLHLEDDNFSTLPNDTLIIFNIESGAFSIEGMPLGHEVIDLERMPDADGTWRIFALEEDNLIYQMDDRMTEHAQDTREFTADVASTGTTTFTSSTIAATGANSIKQDEYATIRDSDGESVWFGKVLAASTAGAVTLVDADTATWAAGATLEVGLKLMSMETTFKAFVGWTRKSTIRSVGIVHTTENLNPTSTPARSFGRVTLIDSDGTELIVGKTWGQRMINHHVLYETGYDEIRATRLRIEIIGNAHVKVKDIQLEVGLGG